ncbi:transporter substrate-binding domain-containing protein [Thalassobacillus sp. C254]|uniref:transporter substrate-binding domain-containing protein n=1 Tax=Thalassobacillus sp. C254 TaxID=1225341 RepID=UPI0006D18D4D|nr:transporter substrate-binding domain-containing protein [Thalassobacillus sp. C254]
MWKAVSMLLLALGLAFSFSYVKAEEDLHHIPVTEQEFIVAYDPDLPPLHLENENLDGFSIEIFNEVAERTGLRIQYIPMSKEESLEAIREREIDMILSINFSEQDAEFMEFSESILSSSVGLVVPAEEENIEGITSLSGQVTALQRETIEYGFLRNVQGIRYQATSNQVTGLELLVSGRADAFVGNVLTAEHFFEERDLIENYQVVNNYVLPVEFSVGVQGEHYQLLHTINRGIREVKSDGTYTQIYENWFVDEEEQLISQLWRALQITGVLF